MIHGYHIIFGTYGFWMPNDPRGSWSDFVGAWDLFRFGPSTKGIERMCLSVADQRLLMMQKQSLSYPPVILNSEQIGAVAKGFERFCSQGTLAVWACAIMPDHAHLVVGRSAYSAEQITRLLKGAATKALLDAGVHPQFGYASPDGTLPPAWARGQWKVFLDSGTAIEGAIRYVECNPTREGRPTQSWPFVSRFGGLDLGTGWLSYP